MNFKLMVTEELYKSGLNARAHYGVFDQANLPHLNDTMSLPKVTVGNISNFLLHN